MCISNSNPRNLLAMFRFGNRTECLVCSNEMYFLLGKKVSSQIELYFVYRSISFKMVELIVFGVSRHQISKSDIRRATDFYLQPYCESTNVHFRAPLSFQRYKPYTVQLQGFPTIVSYA